MKQTVAVATTLGRSGLLVIAIGILVFFFLRIVPGDVVDVFSVEGDLTAAQAEVMRQELGLDAPIIHQFAVWVGDLAAGEFGTSVRYQRPVGDLIVSAIPTTVAVGLGSFVFGVVLAITLAIGAALWPKSVFPFLVNAVNIWSIALPTFCVGLIGIIVFSIWLGWMPVLGNIWLPIVVIGMDIAGQLVKTLHEELKEATSSAHVRTARAKGVHPVRLIVFHLLPTAAPLALALSGIVLSGLVGGTLTMEVLFGLPGIGSLTLNGILGRDYPLIQATLLLLALAVVVLNGLTDLLHTLIDPRPAQ